MKPLSALMMALACTALLVGCATNAGLRESQKLEIYEAHAGVPVDSFHYFGSINGWTPLGEDAIAIWTRRSEAFLLDLYGPCSDIDFAQAISVTSRMGRVSARFDQVVAHGSGAAEFPCRIRQIRPLDVKAIRQAERAARDQASGSGT